MLGPRPFARRARPGSGRGVTRPAPLPDAVRGGTPTLKAVYLYLLPLGTVDLTRRELADLTGLSWRPLNEAFDALERAGLLVYEGERVPRRTTPYRIKRP